MDRSYRAADQVAVYLTQEHKNRGLYAKRVEIVPHSRGGVDFYVYEDQLFAAYVDPKTSCDGCLILDQPLKGIIP